MFKCKSLKKTLIANFSIILVAILMLVLVISLGIANINVAKDTIMDEYHHAEQLHKAQAAHYKWSNSLNSTINYGTEFTGSTDPQKCDFGQFIYGDSMHDDEHSLNFLAEIEPLHNAIHNAAQTVLSQIEINKEQATSTYLNEVVPNIDNLISKLNASIDERSVLIDQANQTFIQILIFAAVACTVVVLFVLMMCIRLYLFLRNEIVMNLSSIGTQVQRLSKGELSLELPTTCKTTEMIEIRDSLEFSVKEISKYIDAIDYGMTEFSKGNFTCECPITFLGKFAHIQKAIEDFQAKMNETLLELDMASAQVSAGASQVADGAQALAQGATEQASSVEELSATIAEISHQITQTAEYSEKADVLGKQAGAVVQKSQVEMKQMKEAIKDIASASENIQRIIKAIDDIAFQTNILALNAAVEAARAGNAGKGFTVVADEVRNLAQKSAEAAKDTTELIETSLQQVSHGEKLAVSTDAAFEEVAKYAEDILGMVEKIAQASNEQALSISQISQGVDQISSVVQMNSATSEESAAASEELSGQAGVMKSLIDQFELSHDMKSIYNTETNDANEVKAHSFDKY